GLLAGWLTAAAFVACATVAAGYTALPPAALSWAGLALATLTGLAVLRHAGPELWSYAAALAWALVGVAAKNLSASPVFAAAALVAIAVLAAAAWRRHPAAPRMA
ncbi:hypothetical protein HKCCE2091_20195, partial [Rhodobacterales bacterium HKCCE2091]|nr:hypothetical protein [Rhodobacterales bacterium HKCCE2091]